MQQRYVEDFAIQLRPKITRSYDGICYSYLLSAPKFIHGVFMRILLIIILFVPFISALLMPSVSEAGNIARPFVESGHSGLISIAIEVSTDTVTTIQETNERPEKIGYMYTWDLKNAVIKYKKEMYEFISVSRDNGYALVRTKEERYDKQSSLYFSDYQCIDLRNNKVIYTLKNHFIKKTMSESDNVVVVRENDDHLFVMDIKTGKFVAQINSGISKKYDMYFSVGHYDLSGNIDAILNKYNFTKGKVKEKSGLTSDVLIDTSRNAIETYVKEKSLKNQSYIFSKDGKYVLFRFGRKRGIHVVRFPVVVDLSSSRIVNDAFFKGVVKSGLTFSKDDKIKEKNKLFYFVSPQDRKKLNRLFDLSGFKKEEKKIYKKDTDYDVEIEGSTACIYKGGKFVERLGTPGMGHVIISPDSKYMVAGVGDSTGVWDIDTMTIIKKFDDFYYPVTFSPNCKYLIMLHEGKFYLFDSGDWHLISSDSLAGNDWKVSFSPDSSIFAVGGSVTRIKVYHSRDGKLLHKVKCGHHENISISNDNTMLTYGTVNGNFRIRDIETSKTIFKAAHTGGKMYGCCLDLMSMFSKDNSKLITMIYGSLKIWDIKNKRLLDKFAVPLGEFNLVKSANNSDYVFFKNKKTTTMYNVYTQERKELSINPKKADISFKGGVLAFTDVNNNQVFWNVERDEEIAKLFIFKDGEWLLITKEGYFDSSKNGSTRVKVRLEDGKIYPVDSYFEQFYRPDIVAMKMSTGAGEMPVEQFKPDDNIPVISDIKPAPTVEIVETNDVIDKDELIVKLKITPDSPDEYGQIRLYLDDTLIKTDNDRGLLVKKSVYSIYKTYTIKVPQGTHQIKAIVFNRSNTMQSPDAVHQVVSTYKGFDKPDIYAVVIGIDIYENPALRLKYAVADAKLFAETIEKRSKGLFGDVTITLLVTKKETTKDFIISTLKKSETLYPHDMFVFYVASHGVVENAKFRLLTSNVGALSSRKIEKESLSQDRLRDLIANIPTSKKFIILDTCNSGALGAALEISLLSRGLDETRAIKLLSRAVGSTIISASSSSQQALEGYKNHGLLTYVLTQGLNGNADFNKDGYINGPDSSDYF